MSNTNPCIGRWSDGSVEYVCPECCSGGFNPLTYDCNVTGTENNGVDCKELLFHDSVELLVEEMLERREDVLLSGISPPWSIKVILSQKLSS